MQQKKESPEQGAGGTPIWVWIVYGLGLFAATIFVFSILFTLGAYLLSDDVPVTTNFSIPAIVLWSVICVVAGGLFLYRRRR